MLRLFCRRRKRNKPIMVATNQIVIMTSWPILSIIARPCVPVTSDHKLDSPRLFVAGGLPGIGRRAVWRTREKGGGAMMKAILMMQCSSTSIDCMPTVKFVKEESDCAGRRNEGDVFYLVWRDQTHLTETYAHTYRGHVQFLFRVPYPRKMTRERK